ncbi:MAG: hypothetical protein WC365_05845 [Candidatus Babeliales bacterium]|jgi:hypothetical protein
MDGSEATKNGVTELNIYEETSAEITLIVDTLRKNKSLMRLKTILAFSKGVLKSENNRN